MPITHGVVQGSLLGPTLLLLFTNGLVTYIDESKNFCSQMMLNVYTRSRPIT